MNRILLTITAAFLSIGAIAQSTWTVDNSHSNVNFTVTHLVVSEVQGKFKTYDGKVVSKTDDFNGAQIDFSVDINSINTDDEGRDKHLRSEDFFNAEKFPKLIFKSTDFKKLDAKNYKLTGDLTVRGVTKKVTYDVTYGGTVKDPWGNTKAGFKLRGTLNRKDYGLNWSKTIEAGGLVVSDEVALLVNLELLKGK